MGYLLGKKRNECASAHAAVGGDDHAIHPRNRLNYLRGHKETRVALLIGPVAAVMRYTVPARVLTKTAPYGLWFEHELSAALQS